MTISARDGEDELGFEMASSKWEVGGEEEEVEEGGEAGCRVREWVEGGLVNRVSIFFSFIMGFGDVSVANTMIGTEG